MPDIRKRKGFIYFVICMVLASFLHAVPVENPVTASKITYHYVQERQMPFAQRPPLRFYISTEKQVVSFEAVNRKNIFFGDTWIYRTLVENKQIGEGKEESLESEGRSMRSRRYHGFRFLTVIFTIFLLPGMVVRISLVLFGSSFIELWQNIYYIHWIDGKKGRRLPVFIKVIRDYHRLQEA